MASTYTERLGLEKPGNNDHVDAWDAVMNANFDAIDAAMFTAPVRTSDPSSPRAGEMWVRSDLGEFRVRVGATTYKAALTAV
jgi:hypothetical protein